MAPTRALLACDVFTDEIALLLGQSGVSVSPVAWLEMGLHDNPPQLRAKIQETLATLEAAMEIDTILLAYGLCGNGLAGVRAGRCQLVLPRAHDCISVFLGGCAKHSEILSEHPATYFYSPGWIRGRRVPGPDREAWLRTLYTARHPDDPEQVEELVRVDQELFAHHDRAAYVDLTEDNSAEAYCKGCAKHLGWDFRRLKGDPSLLRDLFTGPWDESRFLVVPPGASIAIAADGAVKLG